MFGATTAVELDIFRTFCIIWHAGLLYKLKTCGSDQIFSLNFFICWQQEAPTGSNCEVFATVSC